jgi:hypothetical protein
LGEVGVVDDLVSENLERRAIPGEWRKAIVHRAQHVVRADLCRIRS